MQKAPHVFVKVSLDALTSSLVQRLAGENYLDRILHGIQRGVNAGIVQRINVVLRANPQCDVVTKWVGIKTLIETRIVSAPCTEHNPADPPLDCSSLNRSC